MRLAHGSLTVAIALGLVCAASGAVLAQAPDPPGAQPSAAAQTPATASPATGVTGAEPPEPGIGHSSPGPMGAPCRPAGQAYEPMDERMPCPATDANDPRFAMAKKTYTVPAGTKVLLELHSAINTRSAKPGDGVYLASTFPVVVGNRVMIPAGVYVQGVVDRVVRAGRGSGKSQLDMHFTSIIFPNGTVVEIPGLVNNLPGAHHQTVKDDGEGTIEQDPDRSRNMGKVAEVAIPTGGSVGSIGGLGSGHPVEGGLIGIGAGLAAMGISTLFTRGADVNIESGTQVEMVLQRPLVLEEENLAGVNSPGMVPALVPAANQPRPMVKPNHAHILCPTGGLDCNESPAPQPADPRSEE